MLAVCHSNRGKAIPPSERYMGEIDTTNYTFLNIRESYLVYGLRFIVDRVDFLVRPPGEAPNWVPSSLFDLVDARLPVGWGMCITSLREGYRELFDGFKVRYIIGYPLLVNDYQHYVGLFEREPGEVLRFMESTLEFEAD